MNKITIGLINDSYYPMIDGVISVVDNYARRLSKYANVVVFVPYMSDKKYDDSKLPYKVVRCKSLKLPFVDYVLPMPNLDKHFKKEFYNYKLDIIHIHSPFSLGSMGVKYGHLHNIPVIGTMHSQFKMDFERFIKSKFIVNFLVKKMIKVFNGCDECWAVGSKTAQIFKEEYGYKELPYVMENATEMLPIKDTKSAIKEINKLHNIDSKDKVFLYVGRLNKLKNIMSIAEAIKELKNTNPDFSFKFIFIGNGQDEEELINYIKDNNLEDIVIMAGCISDRLLLAKYYLRADLLVFPSLYDTSAIVRIEAASQKTPGLFLEGSATASTIKENVNGYLTKDGGKNIAKILIKIFNNKELYNKVKENAYKDLYINWDTQIKNVYNRYLDNIKKKQ